jgi:elongation factor P
MIQAGDLRPNSRILYNNEPYQVIDVTFVKPGKGGAFCRAKMKNYINNLVREVTFRNEEKIEQPDLEYKTAQFLYSKDDFFYFMDQDSYEEILINKSSLSDIKGYIIEQEIYTILFWNNSVLTITPPIHINFTVKETTPGVRGDTAQGGATKPATLNTGLIIQVPLFVNENDIIRVDTRTNEYVERINKVK